MNTPPILQNPDPLEAYKLLYESLDDAYWEASDIGSKDLVHGVEVEVGVILNAIVQQRLTDNTEVFAQLGTKITATNVGLRKIQDGIDKITQNLATASKVAGAIASVLSLFP